MRKGFGLAETTQVHSEVRNGTRLFKAYVLPHLEYCSPLLLGIGNAENTKLENTNYYLLRSILGYPKSFSYDYLLK